MIVDYTETRSSIKTGDLLAWSHRVPPWKSWHDFKVWIVRLAQMSEYSHVGIAYWEDERLYVVEAVTPRPRKVLLSENLPCYHTTMHLYWTTSAYAKVMDYLHDEGYEYSAVEAIKGFFGINSRRNKRVQCAELVMTIFERCGVFLNCRDIPTDVVLEAQKLGGQTVILEAPK